MYSKRPTIILFSLYSAAMLYLLFFQRIGRQTDMAFADWVHSAVNLIPLRTVTEFTRMAQNHVADSDDLFQLAVRNLGGNVLLFVPLGIFLPALFRRQRRFCICLCTVIAMIALVELTQLFTMLGSCDIDDLILNVCGAVLGFGIWKCAGLFQKNKNNF